EPRISINLALSTLNDRELPPVIDQGIRTWGLDASNVMFEIAESSLIAEAERSVAILTRLKGIGVGLALDDFGSGYSSLAQLTRLPINEIKIDRPFVAGLLGDCGDRAGVRRGIDI